MAILAPFSIVAKNLSTSHDRDIFAGILIGDEIRAMFPSGRGRGSPNAAPVSEDHLRRGVDWGDAPDTPQVCTGRSLRRRPRHPKPGSSRRSSGAPRQPSELTYAMVPAYANTRTAACLRILIEQIEAAHGIRSPKGYRHQPARKRLVV